jgi:antitoxin HicB
MQNFIYPVHLTSEKNDGFIVKFRDIPEAITQGEGIQDALSEAVDCLEEAIANRIVTGLDIPRPSSPKKEEYSVLLPIQMSAKAALYLTMQEQSITKIELAKRLHCDEKEVRRLLDPRHSSKLPRIEIALAAIGRHLVLSIQEAV